MLLLTCHITVDCHVHAVAVVVCLHRMQSSGQHTWDACRVPYTLEVMKGGQIVEKRRLAGRSHFTFGRSPQCEVLSLLQQCMARDEHADPALHASS